MIPLAAISIARKAGGLLLKPIVIVSLVAGVQTARIEGFKVWPIKHEGYRAKLVAANDRIAAEITAHDATKAGYAAAQKDAAAKETRRLATVINRQKEISHAAIEDYRARLAGVRARAERLRGEPASQHAAARSGDAQPVPGVSAPSAGPDGSAAEARLPSSLSLGDALIASETALRLDALQKWVREQAGVNPNAKVSRTTPRLPPAPLCDRSANKLVGCARVIARLDPTGNTG